ncbi:dihydroneopterin aldolase family protein [Halobaculum sp. P14]|uniref:dihydroneopterin aldolase family protein n=1 Tax=Halobaculum sp. P14 TaxID=3421638 RepID=UPI003EB7635E
MVTDVQQACFEAGIKFGSLYHQFAGTPVSPRSARSLERAMAEAIENQPYCESVVVRIDDDAVREAIDHENGYTELTGRLMEVEMRVGYADTSVQTRMEMEGGYPLMKLVDVADGDADADGDANASDE